MPGKNVAVGQETVAVRNALQRTVGELEEGNGHLSAEFPGQLTWNGVPATLGLGQVQSVPTERRGQSPAAGK